MHGSIEYTDLQISFNLSNCFNLFQFQSVSLFIFLCKDIWWAVHEKSPYAVCGQHRPWSACAFMQAKQGLRFPLTESVDTVVNVNEQKMPRLDCTDADADLD